jgi:hypothetical protein
MLVLCPDGQRRTFQVQGESRRGYLRGYIPVNGCSVSGVAKRQGRGWKFIPKVDGKNASLMLGQNTTVKVSDPNLPVYLRNYRATVNGVNRRERGVPFYELTFHRMNGIKRVVSGEYVKPVAL